MFKKVLLIVAIGGAVLVAFGYLTFEYNQSDQPEEELAEESTIEINGVELTVDIADEPQEQTQGLSGRESMAEDQGMLFIFPQSISPGFWMKEMKFSLDIIWIDQNGMIVGIEKNIAPETYPNTFFPPSPIKYVLEVNAGWSDRHNVKAGNKVTF